MATTKTELLADGVIVATNTVAPFDTFNWDSTGTTGAVALTVQWYVDNVLVETSDVVNITVNAVATPTYDPLVSPYMTAISIPDNTTSYFTGTPQELTGTEWWSKIDTFIADLKTATGASDLTTIFSGVYTLFGGGGNTDRVKFNLVDPQDTDAAFRLQAPNGFKVIDETGVRLNTLNEDQNSFIVSTNAQLALDPDTNNDGYFVFATVNSDYTPVGFDDTIINCFASNVGLYVKLNTDKSIAARANARDMIAGVQTTLNGCYAVGKASDGQSKLFKDGVKLVDAAAGASNNGIPTSPLRIGGTGIQYYYSTQNQITTAIAKAPLTETQITAISQAILDFETSVARKNW